MLLLAVTSGTVIFYVLHILLAAISCPLPASHRRLLRGGRLIIMAGTAQMEPCVWNVCYHCTYSAPVIRTSLFSSISGATNVPCCFFNSSLSNHFQGERKLYSWLFNFFYYLFVFCWKRFLALCFGRIKNLYWLLVSTIPSCNIMAQIKKQHHYKWTPCLFPSSDDIFLQRQTRLHLEDNNQ